MFFNLQRRKVFSTLKKKALKIEDSDPCAQWYWWGQVGELIFHLLPRQANPITPPGSDGK